MSSFGKETPVIPCSGDIFSLKRQLSLECKFCMVLCVGPGPMGGKVCEFIRERDPNHPLLE